MSGSSVKSCDLAEFQTAILEHFISLIHCISIRLLFSQLFLFDSRHATSSFLCLQGQRSILFCFVALIFSISNDKEFKLGLCSVVGFILGICIALLSYSVSKF